MTFDYQGALNEGYTEKEINQYLMKKNKKFNIKGAMREGYSLSDINKHLSSKKVEPYKTPYDVPEVSPQQLKSMSVEDRMQYAQDLKTEREYRQSKGATKGTASGLTLGLSQNIPGLEQEEGDLLFDFGEFIGSTAPITKLYNILGKPLVSLASKSPVAKKALQSLASIAGWGVTGATKEALEEAFQGKELSAEDILSHGAEWGAFDAILQSTGQVGRFGKWLLNKSESTKKPSWEVINNLLSDMKKEGVDLSEPDRVTAKVLSILEEQGQPITKELKLTSAKGLEGAPKTTEQIAHERIGVVTEKSEVDLTNKVSHQKFKNIEDAGWELHEPYQPSEINADEAIRNLEEKGISQRFDAISQRAETEQQLGKNIQNDIEIQFKDAESKYKPLYEEVNAEAQNIMHKPTTTINAIKNILEDINSLKTRPEGYKKVIDTLNDALYDLGYSVVESTGKIVIRDAAGNPVKLKPLSFTFDIPLPTTMELGRRLNKIADYDIVGPSIKNRLKPVVRELKNEIKNTLAGKSKRLANKFIKAEKLYGETAEKFGTDAIHKIRSQESPEKITSLINEPSNLENLKRVLTKPQYSQVERELLEQMRDMSFDRARKAHRELYPYLNDRAKKISNELIKEKAPQGAISIAKKIQQGVIEDLNNAFSTGSRPKSTLNLWQTPKGQKLIKDSLKGNPNKSEILKYLSEQSFYDFAESFIEKNGSIDFKKLKDLMKNPNVINDLYFLGGDNAVNFFKSVEKLSNTLDRNIKILEKLPSVKLMPKKGAFPLGEERLMKMAGIEKELPKEAEFAVERLKIGEKIEMARPRRGELMLKQAARQHAPFKFQLEDFMEKYGITQPIKDVFKLFGVLKFTGPVVGGAAAKIAYKMATKPSTRKTIKKVIETSSEAHKTSNITPFILALEELEDEFD